MGDEMRVWEQLFIGGRLGRPRLRRNAHGGPYDDVDHAVALANDSDYGLSGSVWTTDTDRGVEIAARIRTGQVRVNGAGVATDAPFGGFKQSGIGREYGPEGLTAFLETKAIAHRPTRT